MEYIGSLARAKGNASQKIDTEERVENKAVNEQLRNDPKTVTWSDVVKGQEN